MIYRVNHMLDDYHMWYDLIKIKNIYLQGDEEIIY